jgi:hypothetical protein
MTPKQKAAIAKHNAAVVNAAKATHALAQHAVKSKASLGALAKHMVSQKKLAIKLRTPMSKRTHVGDLLNDPEVGEEAETLLGEYYTAIGADPDPNNPGLLTDGSLDPAYGPVDDGSTVSDTPTGNAIDSGTTLPPPPSMDTFIPSMADVGGIAYNGAKGTPEGYVLSLGLATRATDHGVEPDTAQIDGTEHFGYVYGLYDKINPPNGGIPWGSGDNLAKSTWNHIHGRHHLDEATWGQWNNTVDPSEAFKSNSMSTKYGITYGPLVGNPVLADFAHMRVDAAGNMFWLPQEAPDWLTFPLKQAAALTAQAEAKAAADAAAAAAAAATKAAADAASAQAAQDAQNALAESATTSQAVQAQAQAQGEQAAVETQAQQAIVQQSQADVAQQQVDTEQAKQAGALMLQDAQQELAYAQAHPEEAYGDEGGDQDGQQMAEGEPALPGMEDGGGEGDYDDGAPVPGADIMKDADGEGFDE